jgi:hypothetical protein
MNRKTSYLVYAVAAYSGFFVMSVELLGGRLLAPYFGSSIFVWGGLISVFMTCLSLGYLAGGQLSMHSPSMAILGYLLLGAGALALPITESERVLEWLSDLIPDPRYGSLVGSLLIFGAPTIISGMVSPYCVRLLVHDLHQTGRSAGKLYFVSTFGSAAGTILTSFYLVLFFRIDTIIMSMIGLSLGLGVLLLTVQRRHAP